MGRGGDSGIEARGSGLGLGARGLGLGARGGMRGAGSAGWWPPHARAPGASPGLPLAHSGGGVRAGGGAGGAGAARGAGRAGRGRRVGRGPGGACRLPGGPRGGPSEIGRWKRRRPPGSRFCSVSENKRATGAAATSPDPTSARFPRRIAVGMVRAVSAARSCSPPAGPASSISRIPYPASRITDPGSRIRIPHPASRIPHPTSRIPNTHSASASVDADNMSAPRRARADTIDQPPRSHARLADRVRHADEMRHASGARADAWSIVCG